MSESTMPTNAIDILQCNLRRCSDTTQEFVQYFMSNTQFSVALVTEPYVGRSAMLFNIDGVDVFQFPSAASPPLPVTDHQLVTGHHHVKACVLVKKNKVTAIGCSQYSTTNLAVIQTMMDGRKLFIASAYIEPDVDTIGTLDKIENFVNTNKGCLITIGADGNGHHTDWGCASINERGGELAALIASTEMSVANAGSSPTFEVVRGNREITSIVDITFATNNLIDKITDWQVDTKACVTSDHHAVKFQIQGKADRPAARSSTYLYNNKAADWEL